MEMKLTNETYWSEHYQRREKSKYGNVRTLNYVDMRFILLFDRIFPKGKIKLIEVGCGDSRWLPFFAKQFGYHVTGIDYSREGCNLARARLQGMEASIIQSDFLDVLPPGEFDIVTSFGFIEHFKDTQLILRRMVSMLRTGGILFVEIPNLYSITGNLLKVLRRDIYDTHALINPEGLIRYFGEVGIERCEAGYFGSFNLGVVGWSNVPRLGVFRRLISKSNVLLQKMLKQCDIRIEHKIISPYIICFGIKKDI